MENNFQILENKLIQNEEYIILNMKDIKQKCFFLNPDKFDFLVENPFLKKKNNYMDNVDKKLIFQEMKIIPEFFLNIYYNKYLLNNFERKISQANPILMGNWAIMIRNTQKFIEKPKKDKFQEYYKNLRKKNRNFFQNEETKIKNKLYFEIEKGIDEILKKKNDDYSEKEKIKINDIFKFCKKIEKKSKLKIKKIRFSR